MNTLTLEDLGRVPKVSLAGLGAVGRGRKRGLTKPGPYQEAIPGTYSPLPPSEEGWLFGGGGDEPVSQYGIGNSLEGFLGDLGVLDFLKKDVMGIPVWALAGGAAALLFVIPALKGKRRR